MIKVPECLSKRYKALDDIIQELSMSISSQRSLSEQRSNTSNVGLKLMCDFWNILRDDPDCNLTAEVQQRMGMEPAQPIHNIYSVQRYITYMAGKDDTSRKFRIDVPKDEGQKGGRPCCSGTKKPKDTGLALSKVLCNLKQAATFDKKCHVRVKELMDAQKELKSQIQVLEYKERDGVKLLKEADCMWLCMEDAYKKKVSESQERQQFLLKQLKEIEASASKWRKNKKDLEFQTDNMTKARMEIIENMNQKKNDIKIMDTEVKNLTRRIESAKKDLENSKKCMCSAKEASDTRMANLTEEMVKIQKKTNEERSLMKKKENEGTQYVKDTRVDLQNICKILLQKKLENEDLRAERTAVLEEIDLLKTTFETCKDRCKNKEESVFEELKKLRTEVSTFQAKCKRCHVCTDTNDVRKLCTDCPKCMEDYCCKVNDEHCVSDPTMDCVCMSVKQRFLDNVFDNMYTVLERQSKTGPGKALADAILKSLRKSTNGKLTPDIRRILQDFILSTVKKNLNLTIVGGAVKTRCELDPDTYKQLMNCLKTVKAKKPPQEDKGTASKKDPCRRWGASSECNCPRGPKDCICTKKAPPHPNDPKPCPQDKEDIGEKKICPFKDGKVCGPDCGMQGKKSNLTRDIGSEMSTWRPDPCSGPSCPYSKITRAALAQCVLGPESIEKAVSRKSTCTCRTTQLKSCYCNQDRRSQQREKIVNEVMGRYSVVPPIAKVTCPCEKYSKKLNTSREYTLCDCSDIPITYLLTLSKSKNRIALPSTCSSVNTTLDDPASFNKKVNKKECCNKDKCLQIDTRSNTTSNNYRSSLEKSRSSIKRKDRAKSKHSGSIKVILCPKFTKYQDDTRNAAYNTSDNDTLLNSASIVRSNVASSDTINQDIKSHEASSIPRTVVQDIIVNSQEALNSKKMSTSVVEWVTVKELHQEITKLSKLENQNDDAANEVELQCESFHKNTKNLKANLEYRDKNTSIQHWGDSQKDVRFEVPCVQPEFNIQTDAIGLTDNDQNLTSASCQFNNLESSLIHPVVSTKEILSKEFKIAIENNSGQSTSQFTVLTKSKSGTLAMELDEQIIESIQNKTSESPFLFVSLKKSVSGHLVIHLDNEGDVVSNSQKVILRNTQSGTNFLEIHKNVIDILEATEKKKTRIDSKRSINVTKSGMTKDCSCASRLFKNQKAGKNLAMSKSKNKSNSEFHNQTSDSSSKYVLLRKNDMHDLNQRHQSNENCNEVLMDLPSDESVQIVKKSILNISKNTEADKLQDYSLELQQLFEQGTAVITLQMKVKNELFCKFESVITRSLSGSIGIKLIVQETCFRCIPLDGTEYPVCMSKTESGTFIINIDKCHEAFNAVLKKSITGNVMLIPTTPQIKISENTDKNVCSEKIFNLKVNSLKDGYIQLPAVLKLTLSNNFIIVFDKEFENHYKTTLQNDMGAKQECFVFLEKARSGYVIDLNTNNTIPPKKLNALLVKSEIGELKILTQGFECIDNTTINKSLKSSAKVSGELLRKLQPTMSNKFDVTHFKKPKFNDQKSVSDTQLYERMRVKLQINKNLFSKPSAVFKKTESGQFAIILNKESKKAFLNNLISFLGSNPKGLIPITRTDSGEIVINLNRFDEVKGHYGSLKITPSGNVYVLVDAQVIKNMTKNVEPINKKTNAVDTTSFRLMQSVNKGVSTTCNAKPADGDCDISKCVCVAMPFESLEWRNHSMDYTDQIFQPVCWVDSNNILKENGSVSNKRAGVDKYYTRPASEFQYKCTKQCCYVFDTVCPHHNDLYNYVFNEFNNSDIYKVEQQVNIVECRASNDIEYPQGGREFWDSLSYLPPQLPPFLQNVRYR